MSYRMYNTPDARIGYYRGGAPRYGGVGSMAGPKAAGTVAGPGLGTADNSQWHPTVKALLAMVVAEIVAFGVLRYYTKHGG
jgi:hypothetical protein